MPTKNTKRSSSGTPATKWFITAASVVAMLGGWVGFSSQPSTTTNESQPMPLDLGFAPIPTIVPPSPVRQEAIGISDQQTVITNLQTNQPTLRSVSAPRPAPVTITRSSK